MPNDTDSATTAMSPLALCSDEIAALRSTISELTNTIAAHARESQRFAAFASLVQQQQDANQHLVLATLDARDQQRSAEAANARQIEFLAMLAHELRNPLQPMVMANDLLAAHVGLDPIIAKVHDVNARQIARMARLVDDLLDASRVSSGKITLQLATVLLSDIFSDAVETASPGIERRLQRLEVRLPAIPVTIYGDRIRLAQLFANLLINASKFTQEYGHIDVIARFVDNMVEVHVIDDGAGISPELQPFIFDLFTQGYRSLERAQGGLGIGLSLVRTITQLHGGSATIDSEGTGKGSTFIIKLPLSGEHSNAPDTGESAAPAPAPCNILLIEDNIDANDVLTLLLQQDGHTVTSCFDGPSGLRAGLDHTYDIVLCDIGLPGLDGFQVVSAMRAALETPYPYFIATTGYNATDQMDRAIEAGFDQYLVKPVSLAALTRIFGSRATQMHSSADRWRDSTNVARPKKY
jgi:signal transduction histidine kinase/CheY-like chemotaxis protein